MEVLKTEMVAIGVGLRTLIVADEAASKLVVIH